MSWMRRCWEANGWRDLGDKGPGGWPTDGRGGEGEKSRRAPFLTQWMDPVTWSRGRRNVVVAREVQESLAVAMGMGGFPGGGVEEWPRATL